FAENRLIPRFHLEGAEAGRRVSVFKIDPGTGERLDLQAMACVGESGWVVVDPKNWTTAEGLILSAKSPME
ncbi:MAG: hypothetical protein AAB263_07790, partial [Planctomycetota bacterium]